MTAPQPGAVVLPTGEGDTVWYQGRRLYSSARPAEAIRRRVAALPNQPSTLYLAISPLLGYGLAELLATAARQDSHVIAVEADPALADLSSRRGEVADLCRSARATQAPSADAAGMLALVRDLGLHRFRRVVVVPLSAGYHVHRAHYDQLVALLEAEIRGYWQNRLTSAALAPIWIRNLLLNLAVLPTSQDLKQLRIAGPVVVAGAGPSLDMARPWLHRHRSRFTLLAVDTAFPALATDGLRPDAVLSVDGQLANLFDFVPAGLGTTPLVADLTCYPGVVRRARTCFVFSSRFHPLSLFERLAAVDLLPTQLPALGSVGVSAVCAAKSMTDGPVILTGLDFAFPARRTHARGTPTHLHDTLSSRRLAPAGAYQAGYTFGAHVRQMPGREGIPVATTLVLDGYRRQLQQQMEPRISILPGPGLPLAARDLPLNAPFPRGEAPLMVTAAGGDPPRFPAPALRCWLQEEEARLLKAGTARGDHALLRELDYLHFHFPDAPGNPDDEGFVRRVRLHAAYCLERVRQARAQLG